MWFSLFALVLILSITFYQGLLGAFTAAINCILAVLAAAVAFGLYETVYFDYLIDHQPEDGRGIALVGIFLVSLMVMRVIVDVVIVDNMKFPVLVERIAGGAFGLVTAMIIIGVVATGIQMLSFPPQWLGFTRYALIDANTGANINLTPEEAKKTELDVLSQIDLSTVEFRRRSLWLSPDKLAVALASHLSDNALAGEASFREAHPDLLDESHWSRFSPIGQATTVARKPDAIQVEASWELPAKSLLVITRDQKKSVHLLESPKDSEEKLPSGHRYLAVRATLTPDAADQDNEYRFTTHQVRLVAKTKRGTITSYGLVGINAAPEELSAATGKDLYYRLAEGQAVSRKTGRFNFVFMLPDDVEPWYIVFRQNARALVRSIQQDPPKAPLFAAKTENKGGKQGQKNNADNAGGNSNRGQGDRAGGRTGRISRVHSRLEGHYFSNELPFELTQYVGDGLETSGDAITNGRLTATLDKDDLPVQGRSKAINKIQMPDSNARLLHVSMERLFPGSLTGKVMDFAKQNNPVRVKDSDGGDYRAVGMYVFGTVGGKRTFELVYFDDTNRQSSASIAKPTRVLGQHMKPDDKMYYLFEVPPGTQIASFVNPSNQEEDLRSANLVAPN